MRISLRQWFLVLLCVGLSAPAFAAERKARATQAADESDSSEQESVAEKNPNAVYVEGLGRGLLYSIGYDRGVGDHFGLGIGFSTFHVTATGTVNGITAWIIPIYGNFYFSGGNSRFFLTGGFDIIQASANFSDVGSLTGSGIEGTLGGGYEYRADGGFLLRVAPYYLFGLGTPFITGGLTLGYAF